MGQLIITRNVKQAISHNDYADSLQRHFQCDWGDLSEEEQQLNDLAFDKGDCRLISAYQSSYKVKFWIITEANHSATTILLPEDY